MAFTNYKKPLPAIYWGANYGSSAMYQYVDCCNQCVFHKCPCGYSQTPTDQHNWPLFAPGDKVIIGCNPCGGCKCPDEALVYQADINQFKCGPCNCESKGQCENDNGCVCCCFPARASVLLKSQKSVEMSELQIGDKVQAGTFSLIQQCTLLILFKNVHF